MTSARGKPGKLAQSTSTLVVAGSEPDRLREDLALYERGWTPLRRCVFETMRVSATPLTAYALGSELHRQYRRKFNPPTVYRALQFLMDQGVVARLERRNAYMVRTLASTEPLGVLFLCEDCGAVEEAPTPDLQKALTERAELTGFQIGRRIFEVEGVCRGCSGGQAWMKAVGT